MKGRHGVSAVQGSAAPRTPPNRRRSRLFGTPAATSGDSNPSTARPQLVLFCLALALLTILIYAPVRQFGFVSIDDHVYVTDNPFIRSGVDWSHLRDVFLSTYANFWHPLTILSLMLDVALFGMAPGPLHVTNLALHVAATLLLFLVLSRTTRSNMLSAFVAALFAAHPLHVESVAWVSQRKDVLSTVFWMLTLLAYVRFARAPRWSRYSLVLACFALGLMAKPMLVMLPAVLLLLDVWPLRRVSLARHPSQPGGWPVLPRAWIYLVVEKLPLVALSVAASVLAVVGQQRGGAVATLEGFTLSARLANAPIAYVTYVAKMAWPSALTVFYPYAQTPAFGAAAVSTVLLLAVSVLVLRLAPARPYLMVGWFWYVFTLLPVSGLVQVGSHAMADRYTYVPLVGLFLALAWGISDLGGSLTIPAGVPATPFVGIRTGVRVSLAVLGVGVVAVLGVAARAQVLTWTDGAALWRHAIDVTPDNYYAQNAYGLELQKQGRLDEATKHFMKASALAPRFPNADSNLGLLLAEHGRTAEALAHYAEALRRAPDYEPAHANLANLLCQTGRLQEAIAHYEEALRLRPDAAATRSNLANALMAAGRQEEALAQYDMALRLDSSSATAHYNMGNALRQIGRVEAALQQYREAVRLDPSYADAHQNLGDLLGEMGQTDEAVEELRLAVRLAEKPSPPLVDLGNVLLVAGRTTDALEQFRSAVRAAPDSAEAHMGLGVALFNAGRVGEAAEEHALAVRLAPKMGVAHYNLAVTLEGLGRLREATVEYERTLQLEGDSADVHLALANVFERLGRLADASTEYRRALRAQPDLTVARASLGRTKRRGTRG